MVERSNAVIVNISSVNAHVPGAPITDYSALKAAVTSLSKALAEEFGLKGIRVNTVSPGPVRIPLWERDGGLADTLGQAFGVDRGTFMSQVPQMNNMTIQRMTEADEIAALVVFLVSERSAMIVGADYIIDGGTLKSI